MTTGQRPAGEDRPPADRPALELVASVPDAGETVQAAEAPAPAGTARLYAPDGRPGVDVGVEDLHFITPTLWAAVEEMNDPPLLYRHGNTLARLIQNQEGVTVLETLDRDRLRHEVARRVCCYRRGRNGRVAAKPPSDLIRDMLATAHPPLPVIVRITPVPAFAPDGTIQITRGYCPATAAYYEPDNDVQIPTVSPDPSAGEIEQARDLLVHQLLCDFPFHSPADRAHAIGLMLLPFARDLIDGATPLHLIEASTPGTGKGLLSAATLLPGVGRRFGVIAEAGDDSEWRKRLTAALLAGQSAIVIDNVRRTIDSGALAAALTAPLWEDRLLGVSKMVTLPVRCAWIATANNPAMTTEIARRSVRIRLDAPSDRPWLRDPAEFRHPRLMAWATANLGQLRWACLTLIQAWIAAGRPEAAVPPLGSFEDWSEVVGGILQVVGIPGFLGNTHTLYERADLEGSVWRAFVQEWWAKLGGAPAGTAQLYPLVESAEGFDLRGSSDQARKTSLGRQLSNQDGRIFGDYRICALPREHNSGRWQLIRVTDGGRRDKGGLFGGAASGDLRLHGPQGTAVESPPTSTTSPEEAEELAELDRLRAKAPDACAGCGGSDWERRGDDGVCCAHCWTPL